MNLIRRIRSFLPLTARQFNACRMALLTQPQYSSLQHPYRLPGRPSRRQLAELARVVAAQDTWMHYGKTVGLVPYVCKDGTGWIIIVSAPI